MIHNVAAKNDDRSRQAIWSMLNVGGNENDCYFVDVDDGLTLTANDDATNGVAVAMNVRRDVAWSVKSDVLATENDYVTQKLYKMTFFRFCKKLTKFQK